MFDAEATRHAPYDTSSYPEWRVWIWTTADDGSDYLVSVVVEALDRNHASIIAAIDWLEPGDFVREIERVDERRRQDGRI